MCPTWVAAAAPDGRGSSIGPPVNRGLFAKEDEMTRRTLTLALVPLAASLAVGIVRSQGVAYPPLADYLMPRDVEIALARSAAPASVSDRATVKILTSSGYQVAREGDNGVVCMVMRGFAAPTYTPRAFRDLVYDPSVHAPICFTAPAARTAMPYYELRTRLAMEGRSPDQIAQSLEAAYVKGELPRREEVTFAYMWSAHQHLGPGIGAWHPHMMVFAPYYANSMVGGNAFGSPLPQVTDDEGTPFTVVVIPVDDKLAVTPRPDGGASR
jgi:hypothetical protein